MPSLQTRKEGSAVGTTGCRVEQHTRRCQTGGASSYIKHISAFIMSCLPSALSAPATAPHAIGKDQIVCLAALLHAC